MQYELLNYLRCPITKTVLRFELVAEFKKSYGTNDVREIKEGLLFSETGFVFPIIDGIPRMLIESLYDYEYFLQKHLTGYQKARAQLEKEYAGLIDHCQTKNKRTKTSFELEWSILNKEKEDRIWHEEVADLAKVFMTEVNEPLTYFDNKIIIDVGSGHGLMTAKIAGISKLAIGVELSKAVEDAYNNNQEERACYIQGDLQFLPFADSTFDVLYSSGVIHHTNNTHLSLLLIEPLLKINGKICLWLYHPQKNILHNLGLSIRKITKRIPLKLMLVFLAVFAAPVTVLIKKIKNKRPPNFREELINLLDGFTPEFRFEITHDLAKNWLQRSKYVDINITTADQFGFSITGEKL